MRISDWSSDVCSSDLQFDQIHRRLTECFPERRGKRRSAHAGHHGEAVYSVGDGRLFEDRLQRPAQPFVRHRGQPGKRRRLALDRKSVVEGKSVSVSVDLGGRRHSKKKKKRSKE